MRELAGRILIIDAFVLAAVAVSHRVAAGQSPRAITIDYPAEGSIFPPEITAPTRYGCG